MVDRSSNEIFLRANRRVDALFDMTFPMPIVGMVETE
jgi:hypothetical protein